VATGVRARCVGHVRDSLAADSTAIERGFDQRHLGAGDEKPKKQELVFKVISL
jgi:hypothetical protein